MPRTSIDQRWRVTSLQETGFSSWAISACLGISKSTVCVILNCHVTRPHEVADIHRSGRPCKTSLREDRRLPLIALRNIFPTALEFCRP